MYVLFFIVYFCIYLYLYHFYYVFNLLCSSPFGQGHLDPWHYRNAFISIIIIIIMLSGDLCRSGLETLPHNAKMHYNYANLMKGTNVELAVHHYREATR